jgi:hypothetical protein
MRRLFALFAWGTLAIALMATLVLYPGDATTGDDIVGDTKPTAVLVAEGSEASHAHAGTLADTDGYVPEYYVCGPYNGVLGRYYYRYWYSTSTGRITRVEGAIYYDRCEMRSLGAGTNDWARLIAHERAHSRGWDHYEGSPATNAAYYPTMRITGS